MLELIHMDLQKIMKHRIRFKSQAIFCDILSFKKQAIIIIFLKNRYKIDLDFIYLLV